MEIGLRFLNVVPEGIEEAKNVTGVAKYVFNGVAMSIMMGKKHVYAGYTFMILRMIDDDMAAVAVVRNDTIGSSTTQFHVVSYEEVKYDPRSVILFFREGDYKIVDRDSCGMI